MPRKKDKNGATPPDWQAVANASAERDAAERKPAVQTTFLAGDTRVEFVEMPIMVPVSQSEARLLDRDAADKLAEAEARQKALEAKIEREIAPEKAAIKELRKKAAQSAKESAEGKREQMQRVKIVYHPNRATKEYLDPDTGDAVKVSEAMTAAEIERFSLGGEEAHVFEPPTGEAITVPATSDEPAT